jgi:hypothetical protein
MYLSIAGRGYDKLSAPGLALECLRQSIDDFHTAAWPFLSQDIGRCILEVSGKVRDDPIDILVNIVSGRCLTIQRDIQRYLTANPLDCPLACRFVAARVSRIFIPGFPHSVIRGMEKDWNQTCERLFGAFSRGSFYDYGLFRERECCVGESIFLRLSLLLPSVHFDIMELKCLLRGDATAVQAPVSIAWAPLLSAEIALTPTAAGRLEIYGISFEWEKCARFEAVFGHPPLRVRVHDRVPKLRVVLERGVGPRLVLGQIAKIEISLSNSSKIALKSLALYRSGDVTTRLIEPVAEDVLGQSRLRPLLPGEEIRVIVALCAHRIGDCEIALIFPYWSDVPPPRLEHLQLCFEVVPPPPLSVFWSLSGMQIMAPNGAWAVGFTGCNVDEHLMVLDGRFALLDFASVVGEEATEIEEWCLPFVDFRRFAFWYADRNGYVCCEVQRPSTPFAILVKVEGDGFQIEVKNVSKARMTAVTVEIGGDSGEYVVCGCCVKRVVELEVDEVFGFSGRMLVMVRGDVRVQVDVRCDGWGGRYGIVVPKDCCGF